MSVPQQGGGLIEHRDELAALLESGSKPKAAWRIGTEHEKFGFYAGTLASPGYDGPKGIRALLQGMKRFGWEGVFEGETLIGLKSGLGAISLEPGGQFELSGAPLKSIHETCEEVNLHLEQVREVATELGIGFLGLGFHPLASREETPVMPKGRYNIMRAYMPKVGGYGLDMMLRTCTVQVNLDFANEADMAKKLRVAFALQPIATAMFANSPFREGRANGFLSYRSQIWTDTDNARSGMLPFVFEDGFGFERYVDYALDVPMYFVYRDGKYIDASGQSFRDFLDGRLPALPGEKPTLSDWADHLTTIFPEVRLKKYIEMRGADGGPWKSLCALPALWVGLLYDQSALDAAWDLVKDWTQEERVALRHGVPVLGLATPFRGRSVKHYAHHMLEIASAGLKSRARLDGMGASEDGFLHTLRRIVDSGETRADEMLRKFRTEWNGDVRRVFADYAY
ncbi:MAG: glutamate--cysteine ligase [Alphaproteobacteria bacterium]|nr:glutamate--cysteine ligase [Alphaproteobacteria bacterium]